MPPPPPNQASTELVQLNVLITGNCLSSGLHYNEYQVTINKIDRTSLVCELDCCCAQESGWHSEGKNLF